MERERHPGQAKAPSGLIKVTSPLARLLAGRRWFPLWAVMHHVGRRSGTEYAIPVAIVPTRRSDIFLIGLPWGDKTNWAQNVLAAGGARVTWKGQDHHARNPRIVGSVEAVELGRGPLRKVLASGRFPVFLLLDR